jgi:hypothetical protein
MAMPLLIKSMTTIMIMRVLCLQPWVPPVPQLLDRYWSDHVV